MNKLHPNDRIMLYAIGTVFLGALCYSGIYGAMLLVLTVGAVLMFMAIVIASVSQAEMGSRCALPFLGMAMVALLIHTAQGRPEAHFAVFGFLAALTIYRHWQPIVVGAAAIAVHHLSFNFFQQWGWGAICFTTPSLGAVFEHALYVVAEAAVLLVLAWRASEEFATSKVVADLSRELVGDDGKIRFTSLPQHINDLNTQRVVGAFREVERALLQMCQAAASIEATSREFTQSNTDLSARTESAANNLQQTASSIEQLSGSVRHSADAARQASQMATSAAQVAQRGGTVVSDVVSTMGEINAASKKIADIIGVIDGIAFQTNILALNAAVEAARAGEQGRGFAVVASEVRSLAQRSASAAKEIKTLIGASVEKVDAGSKLVQDAGSTMSEIVASVQGVSNIIGDIGAATAEQSSGIGQVSEAVTQLDRMTQQNATLVGQLASAAESLKQQTEALVVASSAFHLSTHGAAVPARLARV